MADRNLLTPNASFAYLSLPNDFFYTIFIIVIANAKGKKNVMWALSLGVVSS